MSLIEQPSRRRAVSDKEAYWTLTKTGVDQLIRLKAIRRPGTGGGEGEEEEE